MCTCGRNWVDVQMPSGRIYFGVLNAYTQYNRKKNEYEVIIQRVGEGDTCVMRSDYAFSAREICDRINEAVQYDPSSKIPAVPH